MNKVHVRTVSHSQWCPRCVSVVSFSVVVTCLRLVFNKRSGVIFLRLLQEIAAGVSGAFSMLTRQGLGTVTSVLVVCCRRSKLAGQRIFC